MGNIAYLKILLEGGADPSAKADDGSTALHCAAKAGQIETANLLLQQSVDLETQNAQGRTPLYEAATSDHQLFVRCLLDFGANPSIRDTTGQSILQYLVAHDMTTMLDLFVGHLGTSCLNQNQAPPLLHIAAKSKTSARTLEHLLKYHDIDVNIREENSSAVYWAVKCGNEDGTRVLVSHKDVDTQGIKRSTWRKRVTWYDKAPLHMAAKTGHESITAMLLGCQGIDVNARATSGRTALHYAAKYASLGLVQLLLAQEDIDTSVLDTNNWAPFHEALKRGDEAIVTLFLERDDIKMRHQNDMEEIVIRATASPGHTELLESLLDRKIISTDAVDLTSWTSLHHAARWGNLDAVVLLLQHKNIQLNAVEKNGETPIQKAVKLGNVGIVNHLLSHNDIRLDTINNSRQTLLHTAARQGHLELTRVLLRHKIIDLNVKDILGCTALHLAITNSHREVVKVLLDEDSIAVDTTDVYGATYLHVAAYTGLRETVQNLLSRIAIDVNALVDSEHWNKRWRLATALDLAKLCVSKSDREAIIQLLKAHGATESTSKDIPETSEITSNEVPDPETFQANINTAIEFPDSNLSVEAEDLDPDVEMGTDPFMGYGDSSCCDDSD
jgi:serine/threonine-protein phosphatase 6 regulatory ankyrin repeat subunit A/serine/threonine-protein phosphatase 6 regulatory ankyrin repeat subunit B